MKNIKIEIEYDGTNYAGWQRQINAVSVQDKIEFAIEKVIGRPISTIGCSRTDAGVHARGQVANFFTDTKIPPDRLHFALNGKLPKDIVIKSAVEVPQEFHSRYSCIEKMYSYTIYNAEIPSPIHRNFSAFCNQNLNFEHMKVAAEAFIGEHDFTAFKNTGSPARSTVRTIKSLNLEKNNELIKFYITADGFLYNMVRIIAGTLIRVGYGKISPRDIKEIILQKERKAAGHTAPANGLCLEKIYY